MGSDTIERADEIDVRVTGESDLPEGWEKTHEEHKKPIRDGMGYYIYNYESEHFMVTQDTDMRDGETVHHTTLMKVKRDENGERVTALGTGVYHLVGVEDGRQAFDEESGESDFEDNQEAHKEAERAAFQRAVELMREVNAGEYEHKRFSE